MVKKSLELSASSSKQKSFSHLPYIIVVAAVAVVAIIVVVFMQKGENVAGQAYIPQASRTDCRIEFQNGRWETVCGGTSTQLPTSTTAAVATTCKIMDIREFAHLRGLTGQTACSNEGLVCKNVFKYYRDSWLDNNAMVQAFDTEFSWLSRCNENLGVPNFRVNLPEHSSIDYAEPYAGPHQIYEENIAVFCCSN